ncbi:MAG: pectate lyase [Planctomycetota bacterium]|nr:MAG: pectate lyase [Planctomycetota bacterium]
MGVAVVSLFCPTPFAFAVDGWASMNGGTTGGEGGTVVTVTNATQFLDYIGRSGKYVIQVDGNISLSGMNNVASDKTIIGVGTNGQISGGGLNLSSVSNIIIRNLRFEGSSDDAINVQNSSTNIWIVHCSFGSCSDGQVDIKRGSDYITVSWCHFQNHDHVCLLGHDDDNGGQDIGHLRVTYHHNYFDGTNGRHPRVRFSALCHVYNNYYVNNSSYGVASTCDAEVLVEGNYFNGCDAPTLVGYGSSPDGDLVERDNIFIDYDTTPETRGTVPEPPYSYTMDDGADVPDIVQAYAGAGTSYPPHWYYTLYGDFDIDGLVDTNDLRTFADYWVDTADISDADYFDDGIVNAREFALFAENWMTP